MFKKQTLAIVCFILLSVYSLILTSFQFGRQDAIGAYESLHKITKYPHQNDLLILPKFNNLYWEIITPLQYFFNQNIFIINNSDDLPNLLSNYSSFFSKYHHVYVLTFLPLLPLKISSQLSSPNQVDFFKSILTPITNVIYQESLFLNTAQTPPDNFSTSYMSFYLYRINMDEMKNSRRLSNYKSLSSQLNQSL